MQGTWSMYEAKNRLSEVVERARAEGVQVLSRRGEPVAVMLSMEEYRRLSRGRSGLAAFLSASPLRGVDLDLTRSGDTGREVDL
jgi:prevent-host-death family protein